VNTAARRGGRDVYTAVRRGGRAVYTAARRGGRAGKSRAGGVCPWRVPWSLSCELPCKRGGRRHGRTPAIRARVGAGRWRARPSIPCSLPESR